MQQLKLETSKWKYRLRKVWMIRRDLWILWLNSREERGSSPCRGSKSSSKRYKASITSSSDSLSLLNLKNWSRSPLPSLKTNPWQKTFRWIATLANHSRHRKKPPVNPNFLCSMKNITWRRIRTAVLMKMCPTRFWGKWRIGVIRRWILWSMLLKKIYARKIYYRQRMWSRSAKWRWTLTDRFQNAGHHAWEKKHTAARPADFTTHQLPRSPPRHQRLPRTSPPNPSLRLRLPHQNRRRPSSTKSHFFRRTSHAAKSIHNPQLKRVQTVESQTEQQASLAAPESVPHKI